MPAQLQEITATYLSERHRFANADGDVVIATAWANSDINAEVTIKGQADIDELQRDQTYRFYGRWTTYKNRRTNQDERQFAFTIIRHSAAAFPLWRDSISPSRPAIGNLSRLRQGPTKLLGNVRQ
jgi:hypothetical protein